MLSLLLLLGAATAAAPDPAVLEDSFPEELNACLESVGWYAPNPGVNPFYLRGDFDDDGTLDHAVAVTRDGQRGILVCWGGDRSPVALGAGKWFLKMKDLTFAGWRIHPQSVKVAQGAGEGPPPKLHGDAILVGWEGTASVVIYWAGKQFRWYQVSQ